MTHEYPQYEGDRAVHASHFHRFIMETGLDTYLASLQDRADLVDSLTPESFADLLVRVHETVTGRPESDSVMAEIPMLIEPDESHPSAFLLPAPEDKQELLDYVLEAAQAVEEPALKFLVLGYGINIAHPFHDGNGRTARALYYLLSRDFEPDNPLAWQELLGDDGDQLMPLNASLFTDPIEAEMSSRSSAYTVDGAGTPVPKLRAAVLDPDLQQNPQKLLDELSESVLRREYDHDREALILNALCEPMLSCIVPYQLVHDYNSRAARDASIQYDDGMNYMLIDRFMRNATERDFDAIRRIYSSFKLTYAKELIDTIAHQKNQSLIVGLPTVEQGVIFETMPRIAYGYTERTITIDLNFYQ